MGKSKKRKNRQVHSGSKPARRVASDSSMSQTQSALLKPMKPARRQTGQPQRVSHERNTQQKSVLSNAKTPNKPARRSASQQTGKHARHISVNEQVHKKTQNAKHRANVTATEKRYYPALDGLRTLAVLSVMLYHLEVGWMQGGLLGVTIFFVLSGFLITGLLIQEWDTTQGIHLGNFWLRRVRRLVPAIATVLVVTIFLTILFNHQLLTRMRPDVLPSLGFVMNWWYIFHDVSYFEALGPPSPIQHFWSLAIEEQFYVIWPIILLGALKLDKRRTALRRIVLVLAIASAGAMAFLYVPGADPSRVYYGTDTRAFSLLIGAWLSMTSWGVSTGALNLSHTEARKRISTLNKASIPALAILLVFLVFVEDMSPILYYGGFVLVSALTAILIVALVNNETILAKVFSFAPLVWIGKRSYGMYLWHYPVTLLLLPWGQAHGGYTWWFNVVVIGITIAVSAAAFTFIEDPIRKGAIGKSIKRIKSTVAASQERRKAMLRFAIPAGVATLLVATSGIGLAFVPDENILPEEAIASSGADADKATIDKEMLKKKAEQAEKEAQEIEDEQTSASKKMTALPYDEQSRLMLEKNPIFNSIYKLIESNFIPRHTDNVYNPLIIADSVLGALAWTPFEEEFPYGKLDNYVGRNMDQSIAVLNDYLENDVVGQVVVYSVFSNHKLQPGKLDEIYGKVGKNRQLFLVTPYVPNNWRAEVVQEMISFSESHEGVHIISWHDYVQAHDDGTWIYPDGIHLTPNGAQAMYELISTEVAPYLSEEDYARNLKDNES